MRRVLATVFLAISDICIVVAAEIRPKRKRARRRKKRTAVLPGGIPWDKVK